MFNFEIKVSYPTINGKQLTHQFLDCKVSKGEAYTYKADEITNHSLKEVLALAFDTI